MTDKGGITTVILVNAEGDSVEPMIILKRERLNEEQFKDSIRDEQGSLVQFTLAKTDNGWISVKVLYEYLVNTFDKWLDEKNIKRPVIVFSDCHETRSNHILAHRLTEIKVILITFVPNTTHMSQPVDVSLFRKVKREWGQYLTEFTRKYPVVSVNANNFPKLFIPFLIKSLSESGEAIANGFRATGVFPFQSDGCNMSKLQVSAARTSYVDPCESIDIDNAMNTGAQTDKNMCVDQGVTCLNPTVTGEHLRFLYPSLYQRNAQADNIIGTLDDIIIDNQPKYLMLRESVRSRAKTTIEFESCQHPS